VKDSQCIILQNAKVICEWC